jgi:tRNA dimethylallyltransferase
MLHQRIEKRLKSMFEKGFVEEVRDLMQRPGLSGDSSSMRAVGYRQVWSHLAGDDGLEESMEKALFATRQLAKRQITWLRSENELFSVDPLEADCVDPILNHLRAEMVF